MNTQSIILVNGSAGAGKTYLINKLKKQFPAGRYTSTTNVSASLIEGDTFYRKLRITPEFFETDRKPHYKTYGFILIDEGSYLSKKSLDWLSVNYPFMDIIIVGDFYQLPPVNEKQITNRDVDFVLELNSQYRTRDVNFYNFLERFKNNALQKSDLDFFVSRQIDEDTAIDQCLPQITYTNENRVSYISAIGKKLRLNAKLIGLLYHIDDNGIQTFAPRNRFWKNNEIVKIIEKHKDFITVLRQNGNKEILSYENLKFWASADSVTAHKIQGQTLNEPYVINLKNIGRCKNITERTKLIYVALSRAREFSQLFFIGELPEIEKIENPFTPNWAGSNENLLNLLNSKLSDNENSAVILLQNILNKNNVTTGNMSIRDLAKLCNVSHTAIIKKMKKDYLSKLDILGIYRPDLIEKMAKKQKQINPFIVNRRKKIFGDLYLENYNNKNKAHEISELIKSNYGLCDKEGIQGFKSDKPFSENVVNNILNNILYNNNFYNYCDSILKNNIPTSYEDLNSLCDKYSIEVMKQFIENEVMERLNNYPNFNEIFNKYFYNELKKGCERVFRIYV